MTKDELLHDVWVNRALAEEDENTLMVPDPKKDIPFSLHWQNIKQQYDDMIAAQNAPLTARPKNKKNPQDDDWNRYFTWPIADKKII